MPRALPSLLAAVVALGACEGDPTPLDGGRPDSGGPTDAGPPDGAPLCVGPRDGGPPIARDAGAPIAPPALDCGTPTFAAGTGLRRRPYLESATPTSVRIAWTSTTGGDAVVQWATSPAGPWTDVDASAEMFDRARTDDVADYVAYDATITGLTDGAAYCYRIVEDGTELASGLRFDAAWTSTERPVRVLAFGDSGQLTDGQLALRDRILEQEHDVFLHLGDIAYGEGTFVQFEERFFDVYRDLLHRVPTFPTPGNHEYSTMQAQPYLDVFHLFEQALSDDDSERYYSFDYANVHFVSIESNDVPLIQIDLRGDARDDDMIDWLREDLAASDAEWKIAFFHHPPFTSSERGPSTLVRNLIVPELEAGGVDLVLVGHDHHYERTVPITELCNGTGSSSAIPYLVAGGGGAGLRDVETRENWFTVAVEDQIHTYVRLELHGCIARGTVIDADGEEVDAFEVDGCEDSP